MKWIGAPLAALAVLSVGLGAVIADPVGALSQAKRARLRAAGARTERFRAPDGAWLSVLELGPLSASVPVVLVHGIGASADFFADAALALARSGRTVVLLDAPGSGESEPPRAPEGYGLPARVAAVEALVRALALEKFDLVGHSLGGWTVAAYALKQPHRVRQLVLVDSGGFTPLTAVEADALRARLSPADRATARSLLDTLMYRKPFPTMGFLVDGLARSFRVDSVRVTLGQLTERDGLLGREAELPAGTALIWGEKETLFPLRDARHLERQIPGARLFVVKGAGHCPPLERPEAFQEALSQALPPVR